MGALFWLFWAIDLVLCVVLLIAGDFRKSFTGNNPEGWVAVLLLLCVLASPLLRFVFRRRLASLIVAALPLLIMLVWYLIDKAKGSNA